MTAHTVPTLSRLGRLLAHGATVLGLVLGLVGCGTDEDPSSDAGEAPSDATTSEDTAGDADSGDASDVPDVPDDVPADAPTDASGVACGAETCAPGQVCFERCLCCGIDTGNPADVRSEYRCVTPSPGCTDAPVECVAAELGCYAFGEWTCSSPCA